MTKRTFLVDFNITKTFVYKEDKFKVKIEVNENEELSDRGLKKLLENYIRSHGINKIKNGNFVEDDEEIDITVLQEFPTLEQMRPAECMKCEVFKNVCQKCTYYINNKCEGR